MSEYEITVEQPSEDPTTTYSVGLGTLLHEYTEIHRAFIRNPYTPPPKDKLDRLAEIERLLDYVLSITLPVGTPLPQPVDVQNAE